MGVCEWISVVRFGCPRRKQTHYMVSENVFLDQTCGFSFVVFLGLSKDGVIFLFIFLQIFKLLTLIESDFWT